MKKLYLLFAGMSITLIAHAQFTAGQKLFGPSFYFNGGSSKSDFNNPASNSSGKSLNLGVGISSIKMKTANTGWGIGLGYSFQHNKQDYSAGNNSLQNNHNFSVNVFRRRFFPLNKKWNLYYDAGVNAGIGFGKTNNTSNTSPSSSVQKNSSYNGSLSAAPGITYLVKKNLLLDAGFSNLFAASYSYNKYSSTDSNGNNNNNSSSGFSISSTLNANDFLRSVSISLRWIL